MREIAREIPIAKPVQEYALKILLATHPDKEESPEITKKYIRFGASPRGAQAIISTAKVRALMEGRFNVSFQDIEFVAYPALRHRFFLNFDAIADKVSADHIISEIIKSLGGM